MPERERQALRAAVAAHPNQEQRMQRRDFGLGGGALLLAIAAGVSQAQEAAMTDVITDDVVVTRLFDAPIERVWRAFTTDADVTRWWGPDGFTAPHVRMDAREGGASVVCMRSPEGHDMWMRWDYTVVNAPHRLEYVQNISDAEGNHVDPVSIGMPPDFPRDVATVVALRAVGDQTELVMTEHTTTSAQMMEMSRLGLEQCMDKMGKIFS
jgi:uncharacterized protein YndB with AHSA1/START domain